MLPTNPIAEKSSSLTPSAYMQMVGIVQGIAMYLLVTEAAIFEHLLGTSLLSSQEIPLATTQALVAFMLIVLTWHVNTQHITAIKRVFNVLDTIIPFTFVFTEYWIIVNAHPALFGQWSLALGWFMTVAVIAYIHLFFVSTRRDFRWDNWLVFSRIGNYPKWITLYVAMVGFISFTAWYAEISSPRWQLAIAFLIFVLEVIFTLLHRKYFWQRITQ